MSNKKGRISVVDLETFGLHYMDDPIIEIGMSIRDLNLEPIASFHALVWDDYFESLVQGHYEEDSVVYKMHTESGLFKEALENGKPSDEVEAEWLDWLDQQNIDPNSDYLAGNSTHFDSTMMFFNFPDIRNRFHHRVIDISSLKVMTELWYPNMAAELKRDTTPQKKHRVVPDIEDSVGELRWYLANVLPEGDHVNA